MEIEQLPPEIVLRDPWAADIVSEDDRNAVCQRRLRALDDAFKDDVAVVLLDLGGIGDAAVKQRVGKRGRERRAEKRTAAFEQLDHFIIRLCAVLDGVDAVLQRNLHAFG